MDKNLASYFKGKRCKIVVERNDGVKGAYVHVGKIIDVSSTHLLEEDRFNRLHLLRLDRVLKLTELKDGVKDEG